jgi:DNA-binding NarL/FixJ family response regulator
VAPIRLLIADDNADFRQSTQLMVSLERDIQVVSLARDGQEAVEMARQLQPDVAVIDIHMPRVDGLTAIRTLAQVCPDIACMAMSYDGERAILRQAMAAGAREYLVKPFSNDELVNAVRRVLRASKTLPPPVAPAPADPLAPTRPLASPIAERARRQELIHDAISALRAGRVDSEATAVYRALVQLPGLDTNTLIRLAEVFLARRDWSTLRLICERLEKLPPPPPPPPPLFK